MELFRSIGERLKEERTRLSLSQDDIADAMAAAGVRGATRQSQSKYEKGERSPDAAYLSVIAGMGVDVTFVVTGNRKKPEGLKSYGGASDSSMGEHGIAENGRKALLQMATGGGKTMTSIKAIERILWESRNHAPLVMPVLFAESKTNREFQVIPKYRDASAGRGLGHTQELDYDQAGVLAFDKHWMKETFGRTDGLATVKVHGDSMEPTLADGETIVIDTHVSQVDTSGVYVIRVGMNVLVKRVQAKLDGTLVIKSDNPQYEAELVRPGAMRVIVAGRMVWPRMR